MPDAPPPVAVFDLDGTLVDTVPDLTAALNAALKDEGLGAVSQDAARRGVGHGARVMIENALGEYAIPAGKDRIDRMHARFLEFYRANIAVDSAPFPGVIEALDALEGDGVRLAVCTNKYEALAVQLLQALGLARRFCTIAGGDTFGVSKPDPRHLTRTVDAAGGGRALMIGDSEADVGAARAAGIVCVAVSFGYATQPADTLGADAVISDYRELPALARRYLGNG